MAHRAVDEEGMDFVLQIDNGKQLSDVVNMYAKLKLASVTMVVTGSCVQLLGSLTQRGGVFATMQILAADNPKFRPFVRRERRITVNTNDFARGLMVGPSIHGVCLKLRTRPLEHPKHKLDISFYDASTSNRHASPITASITCSTNDGGSMMKELDPDFMSITKNTNMHYGIGMHGSEFSGAIKATKRAYGALDQQDHAARSVCLAIRDGKIMSISAVGGDTMSVRGEYPFVEKKEQLHSRPVLCRVNTQASVEALEATPCAPAVRGKAKPLANAKKRKREDGTSGSVPATPTNADETAEKPPPLRRQHIVAEDMLPEKNFSNVYLTQHISSAMLSGDAGVAEVTLYIAPDMPLVVEYNMEYRTALMINIPTTPKPEFSAPISATTTTAAQQAPAAADDENLKIATHEVDQLFADY